MSGTWHALDEEWRVLLFLNQGPYRSVLRLPHTSLTSSLFSSSCSSHTGSTCAWRTPALVQSGAFWPVVAWLVPAQTSGPSLMAPSWGSLPCRLCPRHPLCLSGHSLILCCFLPSIYHCQSLRDLLMAYTLLLFVSCVLHFVPCVCNRAWHIVGPQLSSVDSAEASDA